MKICCLKLEVHRNNIVNEFVHSFGRHILSTPIRQALFYTLGSLQGTKHIKNPCSQGVCTLGRGDREMQRSNIYDLLSDPKCHGKKYTREGERGVPGWGWDSNSGRPSLTET